MDRSNLSRRTFNAGLATLAVAGSSSPVSAAQQIGDIIDIYDENDMDLDKAISVGARAVLHETNYFARRDGKSAKYQARKAEAKRNNILWGAFTMMTDEPIDTQYERLIAVEDFADGTTLLALDWEDPGHGKRRASYDTLKAFVERIHSAKGFYPLIYGSNFVTENQSFIAGDGFFAHCPLWIAAPGVKKPKFPSRTWQQYTLWQYQFDDVRLSKADWSHFNGTLDQMRTQWTLMEK